MSSLLPPGTADEVVPCASILEANKRKTKFDELFEELWQRAPLWYELGDLPSKRLEGLYGFIVELNVNRAQCRRAPEDIQSLCQPFDPTKFNFGKVDEREVLFRQNDNALIVNVSPLAWCHSLVVPTVSKCLPQVLTEEGLSLTIDLMFRSGSADLRGGFNSLGGFASVNHQHLHLYYLRHRLALETISVSAMGPNIFQLTEYPANGLVLSVSEKDRSVVGFLLQVTTLLLENNISYNIFLTRGSRPALIYVAAPTSYEVIRVYLWARKPFLGVKNGLGFSMAFSELSGYFPVRTQQAFDTVTHEQIENEQKLCCEELFAKMIDLLKTNKLLSC